MNMILPKLLHLANSSPPSGLRGEFYELKKFLLGLFGKFDGYDIQHIEGKKCFSCHGSGMWESYYWGDRDVCHKCGGNGWYKDPVWVLLSRSKWGKYSFHTPVLRVTKDPGTQPTIFGYVEHEHYGNRADVAFVWLCILTLNWRLAMRWFAVSQGFMVRWWRCHPFFWVQALFYNVTSFVKRSRQRCPDCKKRSWRTSAVRCDRCRGRRSSEVPF